MKWYWDGFLIEGNLLFNYMKENFELLFDENNIKHFDLRDWNDGYDDNTQEMLALYNDNIQKELIQWIQEEIKEERLFQRNDWKPFRYPIYIAEMYLGYRKLFEYNNHFFQLAIEVACYVQNCKYCKVDDDNNHCHFSIILYENSKPEILKANNYMMPESDWSLE
jgi:hypothetical protein